MCSLVGKQLAKSSLQVSTGRCMGGNGCLALAGSSETDFQGVKLSTFHPKSGDITRKWYVIDATDVVLGKLASTVADLLVRVIEESVAGMMPHNKLSRASIKKLHVFAGEEHPYAGQKPETFEFKQVAQ